MNFTFGKVKLMTQLETILVVDDQLVVREVVRKILVRAGFCVLVADSGLAAIQAERITQGTIHLLLSDVMMPGMAGPVVAHLLKKHRPEMRVMLMSGLPDGEMSFLDHGWHFIQKPFLPSELVEKVHEVLRAPERNHTDRYFSPRRNSQAAAAGA